MAELYDPNKHGQIQPLDRGFETYDPAIHGEITPLSETPLDAQTLESMRGTGAVDRLYEENPQGFIPTGDEAGYTPAGPGVTYDEFSQTDRAGMNNDASVLDRRNWPAAAVDVVGGVYEGARRLGELSPGRQAVRMGSEALFGEDITEPLQAPEYTPTFSREAVEIGATALPTFKGAQVANLATQGLRTIIQKAAGTAGGAAGYALSKRPGEDRMFMGDDAFINIMGEIFPDADPETVEGRAQEMVNDFADAMILAYPAERLVDHGTRVASAINSTVIAPFWRALASGKTGLENQVGQQFVQALDLKRAYEGDHRGYLEALANHIKENAEVFFGDQKVLRDTMSAIEEGATDEATKVRARSIRAGELAKTGPHTADLELAVSRPSTAAEGTMKQTSEAFGGSGAVEEASAGVQRQAREQFETGYEAPLREAEEGLASGTQVLGDILEGDPDLEPVLRNLDNRVNIDTLGSRAQTVDDIRTVAKEQYDIMKDEMDALADEIEPGHIVDLTDNIELFDSVDSKTLRRLKRNGDIDIELDEDGLPLTVSGDYKDLYGKMVPTLSKQISSLMKSGKVGEADDLIELRQVILDAAEGVPGAERFHDYYKTQWARMWRDGKLEDFANAHRAAGRRGEDINRVNFAADTRKIIEQSVKDPDYAEHLVEVLARGERPELLVDFVYGDIGSNIQKAINSGVELRDLDLATILRPAEELASSLSRVAPQEAEKLNRVLTRIRDAKGDIKAMESEVKMLTDRMKDAKKDIFNRQYAEFFNTSGIELPDAYKNFSNLIKSGDVDRISQIVDAAPETVRKGMKVAFIRELKDQMFTSGRVPGGGKAVNLSKLGDAEEGASTIYRVGEELFKDTPETYKVITGLLGEAGRMSESLAKGRPQSVIDPGLVSRLGGAASDKLITVFFGVLNRVAARARAAIKGTILPSTDPALDIEQIAGRFMADPKYAEGILRRLANKKVYGPEDRRAFIDMMLLATGSDDDSRSAIEQAVDAEMKIRGVASDIGDVYDQTMGIFGSGE